MQDPPPLFVVGMPRSGTKLLREILNAHPKVAIPEAETEFLPWLDGWVRRHGRPLDDAAFAALWRAIRDQQFFAYLAESGRRVDAAEWRRACTTHDVAGLFEGLVRAATGAAHGSGRIWGDKSPSYVGQLPLIRGLFPRARVLHLIRDVRDHCVSMRNAWGKDVARAAQRWVDGVTAARQFGHAIGADYLELRYEDLIANPRASVTRVCEWLDLEFVPAMLELRAGVENLGDARGAATIVGDNRGKYRGQLSERTLRTIEGLSGPLLTQLGYRLDFAPQPQRRLSKIALLRGQIADGVALLQFERRQRGWIGGALFHWRRYRAVQAGRQGT